MTHRTWYVTLFRTWVSSKSGGRWATHAGVSADRPFPSTAIMAAYQVDCPTKSEAVPVVMEWLAGGRRGSMTVATLWDLCRV